MADLHHAEEIIGSKYRILHCIGEGAFGTTYEAEEIHTYQRVAIKAVSLRQISDWKVLELVEREARILETLDHPFIPNYIDYFQIDSESDRRFYLVQELVSGRSLDELVEIGWHTTEEDVKEIALQVLNILEYLHELTPPVIHRDIKPQNIIRRPDGRVYLVDFGAVQDVYRNTIAKTGTFVGTVGYMPAEQYTGSAFFSSDLYALGATLLFLLTHRSPADLPEKRLKIDFRDRINVSPQFANWLDKILEPAVEDRFQSVAEAKAALEVKPINLPNLASSQSNEAIGTSATLNHPQPAGSLIQVSKTAQKLKIKIIPALSFIYYLKMSFVCLAIGLIIAPFISLIMIHINPHKFDFYVGFYWVLLLNLCVFLYNWLTTIELILDVNHLQIYWKLFNIPVWKITQPLSKLYEIKFEHSKNFLNQNKIFCIFVFRQKSKYFLDSSQCELSEYKFAKFLNPPDTRWLVLEMSDFIHQLQQRNK